MENENNITIPKKEYDTLLKAQIRVEILETFFRKSEYVSADKGLMILGCTTGEEKA